MCSCLTFDTPEIMRVLRFVGVFLAALDSVSCRMAVSATGSSPLERRLLSEGRKQKMNMLRLKNIETENNIQTHVSVNVQRFGGLFGVNCSTAGFRTPPHAHRVGDQVLFRFYHVTPQLGADSTLHLLCKTLRSQNSLLEMGLPRTSDSTTGLFSVTSTLDGEHRGDSPAASQTFCYFGLENLQASVLPRSLSLALSVLQHITGLLPFLQRFISKCFYL